jgi:hypothetical protein
MQYSSITAYEEEEEKRLKNITHTFLENATHNILELNKWFSHVDKKL